MTPQQAIADAKKGKVLPVYVLAGEERFLRDQVVAAIRSAALGPGGEGLASFNEDKFTAGEADVDKILSAVRTVPMMSPKRFVLVRGVERWDGARDSDGDDTKATPPLDKLAIYAAAPIDSSCLVLVAEKLDGRRKLTGAAKRGGFFVACEVLEPRALPQWIVDRVTAKGHAIDRDVAEFLAEIAGPELAYVNDAIERLALYAGEGAPITEQAVSECIARVRTADTWALVDALGKRDLAAALRLLAEVYDPRDRGLMLLGAVAWSVRQLAKFQAATSSGASTEEAAMKAGVPPFRGRELAGKLRAFRGREVERWLVVLAETDVALKSSRRAPDAILEDMLTRLCKR